MLARRLRRRLSIEQTMVQCLEFAGIGKAQLLVLQKDMDH